MVQFYELEYATGATGTTQVFVGYHDQIILQISNVAGKFASDTVYFTLEGTYDSGLSAQTAYYFDYVCPAAGATQVTASTGGLYELPFGGGIPYVRVSFDTQATGAGTMVVIYPRTNY